MDFRRLFGVGPTGIGATILIWLLSLQLEAWLRIPKITMGPTFRWVLLGFFIVDAGSTIVWSLLVLPPSERGKRVVATGPFRFVRHPLYSAIIWSGTGAVAIWYRSWLVIFSVIIINFFWTWHIQKEERYMVEKFGDEYRKYMKNTGQFFPRFTQSGEGGTREPQ